jgi:hypothetical protein
MSITTILLMIASVLIILLIAFLWIAKKGRELRRLRPLPPTSTRVSVDFVRNGTKSEIEIISPFYFGTNASCNILLPNGKATFEACIFYHNHRFAIQSLEGAGELEINGEEVVAAYLKDGDRLTIGEEEFIFRCF